MRQIAGQRTLQLGQAGAAKEIKALFRQTADEARRAIQRYTGTDGFVVNGAAMRSDVIRIVESIFVNPVTKAAFRDDKVTAQTAFAEILNKWYYFVVSETVYTHQRWMKKNIPDDIYRWLSTTQTTTPETLVAEQVTMTDALIKALRIFQPNPMAEIDPRRQWVPMHNWNDPNGYILSDRIWRNSNRTLEKIDRLLAQGLRDGQSALSLANALEAYLVPGREGIRTLRPYGPEYMPGGASYDAMRLARTEYSRAFNQAAFVSSYLNPYVSGGDWALSASHPRYDVCDQLATIGMGGGRIREPYSFEGAQIPPAHPLCLCIWLAFLADNPRIVSERLRTVMNGGTYRPSVTPAKAESLIEILVGNQLVRAFRGVFQQVLF